MAENQAMNQPSAPAERAPALPFPLQEGETVVLLARRHWIFLWPNLALHLLIGVGAVVALYVLLDVVGVDAGSIFPIIAALWLIFWGIRAFLAWYHYHNDIWVITNQRLVDAYKKHPFSLRVATADLVNVQDMSVNRHGILATMLDYGDVICQTAGASESFLITGVPKPREVQARLDSERDRERLRGTRPAL